jgi:hypothetical protein
MAAAGAPAGTGSSTMGASAAAGMVATTPTTMGGAIAPGTEQPATGGAGGSVAGMGTGASSARCDMTGRWLQTVHKVTDGLGNLQTSHNYFYYEVSQQGDAFTVDKSLFCFADTVGGGDFAVSVDFSGAFEGLRTHVTHTGRKGTITEAADGCMVQLDKLYTVFGATLPYYLDPGTTLPSAEEPAANGQPGWEDWDNDGQPGVTAVLSGTVTGKIFTASREWTSLSGTVPDVSALLKLPLSWDAEPNVMAYDGSPLLGSTAVRAADATLHFVQMARLSAEQAVGDDATLCKQLVELAPSLTPEAAGM